MRDHARRFVSIPHVQRITQGPVSVGDLTKFLDDRNRTGRRPVTHAGARGLAGCLKEAAGTALSKSGSISCGSDPRDRHRHQAAGRPAEPWGRLRDYLSLSGEHPGSSTRSRGAWVSIRLCWPTASPICWIGHDGRTGFTIPRSGSSGSSGVTAISSFSVAISRTWRAFPKAVAQPRSGR